MASKNVINDIVALAITKLRNCVSVFDPLIFGDASTLVFGPCHCRHFLVLNIIIGAKII